MDLYSMRDNPRVSAWMGVGLVAALVAVVVLALADFNHAFSRDLVVTADLPQNGAVVAANSSVHYRGVEVGKVIGAPKAGPGGEVQVKLRLDPDRVDGIPDTVRVVVGPLSVFGNQYVNLVTGEGDTGPTPDLRAGARIPAVSDAQAPSLQATFTSLNEVLDSVHPAELNVGLSGLSQALAGRGQSLGQTLVSADVYLNQMLELWPTVVQDLRAFAPFATTLAQAAPDFIDLLKNATVTSKTLVKHRDDFASLLANGGQASQQVATLIEQTTKTYGDAVAGAAVLLDALSQNPRVIGELLKNIAKFGGTWSKTMYGGTVHVAAKPLNVTNPAYLALALVSGEDVGDRIETAIEGDVVNPPTYTDKDCPRYGNLRGHCGGGR